MLINPVILGAVVLQGVLAKVAPTAGAIAGFVITAGILIWGLTAYSQGNYIALFGITVSEPFFILMCLVWFAYDAKQLRVALTISPNDEADKSLSADGGHLPGATSPNNEAGCAPHGIAGQLQAVIDDPRSSFSQRQEAKRKLEELQER